MEITKKPRFTPNRMLNVLNEMHTLCKRRNFFPNIYVQKQPSVWHFTRALRKNGVVVKVYGQYKWVGGEPNNEMANSVLEYVREYNRTNREKREVEIQNTRKSIPEMIDFTTSEVLPELEFYEPIKEDLVDIHQECLSALKDFKEDLDEANLKIASLKEQNKELFTNNSLLLDTKQNLKKQLAEYELEVSNLLKQNGELKYQIDKTQEVRQEKKSKQRKVKFLGITIFKID